MKNLYQPADLKIVSLGYFIIEIEYLKAEYKNLWNISLDCAAQGIERVESDIQYLRKYYPDAPDTLKEEFRQLYERLICASKFSAVFSENDFWGK